MGNAKTEKRKRQLRNNSMYSGSQTNWKSKRWAREYRKRIQEGKEYCRACMKVSTELTFDHIIPRSKGGSGAEDNITILCVEDQQLKADNLWPWLISLYEERTGMRAASNGSTPYIRGVRQPFHPEQMRNEMGIEKPEPLTQRIVVPPTVTPKIIDHTVNERIDRLETLLSDAAKAYADLERDLRVAFDRIKVLEDAKGIIGTVPDPLYAQIVELLKSYQGLKMNTGTIAENLGSTSMKISEKLKTLVNRGLLKTEKREGASAMFWWEDTKEEVK